MKKAVICCQYLSLVFIICLSAQSSNGQIRSGGAFLKILPGARTHAMASTLTSDIDELYAIYANPGATGFLREWQWSASYNKWIADVYNASLIYGRRIRTHWSQNTHVALGMVYHGVPEFDSSDRATPNASADEFIASLSLGQPLTIISDHFSFGANFKYMKSNLDQYSASSLLFDAGLLARTPRFNLDKSIFDYGILTAGVAITQVGKDLIYENIGTPLPQAWRIGASFFAGKHLGLQLQLQADYHNIKDDGGLVGVGAEISWKKRFSLCGGYNSKSDLMSQFSFGVSVRLDDITTSDRTILPGRNNAIQFDLATLDEGEFFSRTYHGSVKHFPISPENFRFSEPAIGDTIADEQVVLKWEQSSDPDLYDDIRYRLLMDRDSTIIIRLISFYDGNEIEKFDTTMSATHFFANEELASDSFLVKNLSSGRYYWTVIASDIDGHFRFAHFKNNRIANFYIPFADIEIKNIEFKYSPWITQDDYHGELLVTTVNNGDLAAKNFTIAVFDSILEPYRFISEKEKSVNHKQAMLLEKQIEILNPGETKTIQLPWHTNLMGYHRISAIADSQHVVKEENKKNNVLNQTFHTIPKGTFECEDTVTVINVSQVTLDIPIITEVCFDTNSTTVTSEYLNRTSYDPPLAVLAERLNANRDLTISLQGFIDSNYGETDITLADARALAVRQSLVNRGVNIEQVKIIPGKALSKRPVPQDPQDSKWVFEERRFVKITSDQKGQSVLFQPVSHVDNEEIITPIPFHSNIRHAVPINQGWITCFADFEQDSMKISNLSNQIDLNQKDEWRFSNANDLNSWVNKIVGYYLTITDSLGRAFRTVDKATYLTKSIFQREHRIAFPLKFANTDPLYSFYWSRIFEQVKKFINEPTMRMQFCGHACAVGEEVYNNKLANDRAKIFHKDFLEFMNTNHRDFFNQMLEKLNPAQGFGESQPLAITRLNGEKILIGDNEQAIGRKLNRRIEIVFSMPFPGQN